EQEKQAAPKVVGNQPATSTRSPLPDQKQPPVKADSPPPPRQAWADASRKQRVTSEAAVVLVGAARVDNIPLRHLGQVTTSKEKHLWIGVGVANSSATRKVDYQSWGDAGRIVARHTPRLTDNFGNRYKRVHFGFGTTVTGQLKEESIHPGKAVV